MTRRSRGDTRSCPRWSAPCVASLESSTASLVSADVVTALPIRPEVVPSKMYLQSSPSLHGIAEIRIPNHAHLLEIQLATRVCQCQLRGANHRQLRVP